MVAWMKTRLKGYSIHTGFMEKGFCYSSYRRALRPPQHLDLADIHHDRRGSNTVHVHIINGDTDRGKIFWIDKLLEVAYTSNLDEAGA